MELVLLVISEFFTIVSGCFKIGFLVDQALQISTHTIRLLCDESIFVFLQMHQLIFSDLLSQTPECFSFVKSLVMHLQYIIALFYQ